MDNNSVLATLGMQLPKILGAVGLLIAGWLIAVIVKPACAKRWLCSA